MVFQEELREEKSKAKEEAEDLAQEMAELRYQMTGLLEEERKRRAHIEQASIQRIAELELKVKRLWSISMTFFFFSISLVVYAHSVLKKNTCFELG